MTALDVLRDQVVHVAEGNRCISCAALADLEALVEAAKYCVSMHDMKDTVPWIEDLSVALARVLDPTGKETA